MTLEDWLRRSEAQLRAGPHPERARRDAELLLLHILRKTHPDRNRAWLIAHTDLPALPEANQELRALVERRLRGEPIQYIAGKTEGVARLRPMARPRTTRSSGSRRRKSRISAAPGQMRTNPKTAIVRTGVGA